MLSYEKEAKMDIWLDNKASHKGIKPSIVIELLEISNSSNVHTPILYHN